MKNGAERVNYQPIFMFPARVMTCLVILQYPGTIEGSGKSNVTCWDSRGRFKAIGTELDGQEGRKARRFWMNHASIL